LKSSRRDSKRLPCAGNIHFTEDDFEIITEYGKLLHSPEKPEFNKMQFRDMMRNELFRFARRNLANALQESEGEEFRQLVLMLKLMETNLTSKLDKTATCSCKAAPEGDLRTMQMLESVVKGQRGGNATSRNSSLSLPLPLGCANWATNSL